MGGIKNVKVGDLVGFETWLDGGDGPPYTEPTAIYLITKTSNRFRYDAILLLDGTTTQLDKRYTNKYGIKVA